MCRSSSKQSSLNCIVLHEIFADGCKTFKNQSINQSIKSNENARSRSFIFLIYKFLFKYNYHLLHYRFLYINDFLLLNNRSSDQLLPIQLEIKETTDTTKFSSFLDQFFKIDRERKLDFKIYDKKK